MKSFIFLAFISLLLPGSLRIIMNDNVNETKSGNDERRMCAERTRKTEEISSFLDVVAAAFLPRRQSEVK